MSELAVADGQLPPWVLESGDTEQVAAGETTRNRYAIPEPEESTASNKGVSQNQPAVATTTQDDTVIEDNPTGGAKEYVAPAPKHETAPAAEKAVATTKTTKSTKTIKTTTTKSGKKVATVKQPTLVVYKVRKGDSLSDIAARSHTTVAQIKKDSGLKSNTIRPGQVIKVRFTPSGYKGKTSKTDTSSATKSSGGSYTVKQGDTISGIAKKNGVSNAALLAANGLSAGDAAKLRPGKKLVIPSAMSSSKKTSSKKSTSKKRKK